MASTARLLDLTRLVQRLGKGQPTGIDRVEAAYLDHFLTLQTPVYGLVRSRLGFLLLNKQGMAGFRQLLSDQRLPPPDWLSRLTRRNDAVLARSETATRRLAFARSSPWRLAQTLRHQLPGEFDYFNTGHANLTRKTLTAIKASGGRVAVLVHDTIPLDHPEYTRPDTITRFGEKLASVAAVADLVIHTARTTQGLTEAHFARLGRTPPGIVAPLGIVPLHPNQTAPRPHPYFVTLGTIEPRKNHGFLLDLWAEMHRTLAPDAIPHLLILGRRGWSNEAVFQRLDTLPFIGQTVFEMADLADDDVAGLLANSCGLLFPSHVEGYGLPPFEAATLGVAVIVPPLAIYRETLGNYPVYAALDDSYSWMETIMRLKDRRKGQTTTGESIGKGFNPPSWEDHFKIVLSSF
ncbi:glycosyltransferase [Pseudorhodobacter sp. W20_MBD10_FR17]|uniref:glycosyltransferase n=1 Tax=Pseudorhodobacter sp. W20_MBD10_FR17 TaxID=3240266 RepID=UPI003F968F9B